jgi:membrane-anchored protein YejM (alkaline phosphatase superfamily)
MIIYEIVIEDFYVKIYSLFRKNQGRPWIQLYLAMSLGLPFAVFLATLNVLLPDYSQNKFDVLLIILSLIAPCAVITLLLLKLESAIFRNYLLTIKRGIAQQISTLFHP